VRPMTTTGQAAPSDAVGPGVGASQAPVRVFVVADVRVYRELLADALASEDGFEVDGSAPGDIAGMAIGMTEPGVVVVDTGSVPGPGGVRALAAAAPTAKIVAVGIPDDERAILALAEAGVAGYVTVEQPLGELVAAVEAAANDELQCSPRVAAALAKRVATLADGRLGNGDQRLTRREREIAALIAEGLLNKQIARRLSIEQATVKNHVHNILAKLGASRRDEVAVLLRAHS
jgi:two-component system, NarL family, nitrate/nitrite response regulator NarL